MGALTIPDRRGGNIRFVDFFVQSLPNSGYRGFGVFPNPRFLRHLVYYPLRPIFLAARTADRAGAQKLRPHPADLAPVELSRQLRSPNLRGRRPPCESGGFFLRSGRRLCAERGWGSPSCRQGPDTIYIYAISPMQVRPASPFSAPGPAFQSPPVGPYGGIAL